MRIILLERKFSNCMVNMQIHLPQWEGQYLIAGYASGEVLLLDFGLMLAE